MTETEVIMERLSRIENLLRYERKSYWTLAELSEEIGMSEKKIKSLANRYEIPCYKPAKRVYLFDKAEIREWLNINRMQPAEELTKTAILDRYIKG